MLRIVGGTDCGDEPAYCSARNGHCPVCGANRAATIARCPKPFSPDRMKELFKSMHEAAALRQQADTSDDDGA